VDLDGTPELGFDFTLTAPAVDATHPAATLYEVELYRRSGDKGTDGNNVTGYTFWKKFTVSSLTFFHDAKRKYFHKARARGISFVNQTGNNWSPYISVGVQPPAYAPYASVTASAPAVVPIGNGFSYSWVLPSAVAYHKETEILVGGVTLTKVPGTAFTDMTARTAGTSYAITLKHYDKAGQVTIVSAATNAIFRLAQDTETDQTTPGAPGTPTLTQVTADTDQDGTLDTGLSVAFTAPASGRAPKKYYVEIWRRKGDKGTDGNNVTGYTLWKDFNTKVLSRTFRANAQYFHKARITPLTSNDIDGTPSAYTTVGVQPAGIVAGPTAPAAFDFRSLPLGVEVVWPACPDVDYAYTEITFLHNPGDTPGVNETPYATGIQFNSASYGRVRLYIGLYYDGFLWLRHVNKSGKKSAWVQNLDRFYAYQIDTVSIGDWQITRTKIENDTLTIPFAAADNTSLSIAAGNTVSAISVTAGSSADTDVVALNTSFKNTSGGARTFDVSIERGDGTVLRSYQNFVMADNQNETFFATDKPDGNHSYRMMVTAFTASTVSRRVIEGIRSDR
jgi:hypothetical protein